ncbi:MAG: hypothetical protein QOF78_1080 [Phycisphaerales bacterium]|jgi:hypothetical protein|nr:hypothetical protein [Phycisphaerales bacterium]
MSLTSQPYRPSQQIDGPWLADKRWGGGRIADRSTSIVVMFWIFAVIWNTISTAATVAGLREVRAGEPIWYFILILPLVGIALLAGAVRATVRRAKFGRSYLELETMPGCPGGWLAGMVQMSAPLRDIEFVRVTLCCVNRVTTGSGKNRHTRENTLWEQEQVLGARLPAGRDGGGQAIPIAFRIPRNARATSDSRRNDILWRLSLSAPMPGADYTADFVVPVFHAAQAADFVPQAEALAATIRAPAKAVAVLDDSHLEISTSVAGQKRFVFPATVNRRAAVVVSAFILFFGGIAAALLCFDGPTILAAAFGLVAVILTYVAALYWFRHIELEVDRQGVRRRWRALVFAGDRRVNVADIVGLQKDNTSAVNGKRYYTIHAMLTGGGKVSLVSGLRSNDADRVRDELLDALGQHVDHAQRADQQADDAVDREERQANL